ncbi:MAG: bifunctional oligoribonuclease/PAP phosphatase NrnA [Verrucomicrobiota bacterium]|jgi:phosphoesterase RecJ-like protein|nr:bifunctional oligoribonuclease/PAP phosphatase NrnA [Verrucomicrobiota bacterium]
MKKTRLKTIDRILEIIGKSHTIAVCSHMRPDGDCIGSTLGLALALLEQGKEVICWNQDPVPSKLRFLDPDQLIQSPRPIKRPFDCVISVDAASIERLGTAQEHIANRGTLINIDHHTSNTRFGDVNWIASKEPSSGELVYQLIREAGWKITPRIADCLFTAISTDTGSFQYPSTLPETYYAAGDLVKKGANLAIVCDEVYQSYPLSRVKLLKRVYNNFRLTHDNQIAYFWLKQEDFSRTGATASDTEGLIDHVRAIDPVVVACVFEELEPELTRISLRSKDKNINVSDIAGLFGGGGHPAAAGARIPGKLPTTQRRVVAAIRKALDARAS